ncbi:MAG: DUF4258 domain-containing protein [Leptolyngbya sp.]|nr:DUF4258 domain-containing protein [Leptolyngbya sp.]
MKLKLSIHAKQEMQRRDISLDQVNSVVNSPQQILTQEDGVKVYQSQIDFPSGKRYLVRIFLNTTVDPAIVVTLYKTSKIQKYWK